MYNTKVIMRVITGKYKGRTLIAPKEETRPTLDRMKETLFNIINDRIVGATVLDLFAGSGQIAIECLSRGVKRVILCDNSKAAVSAIKQNYQKVGENPELMFCDYKHCLMQLNCKPDIIFVDPPYRSGYYSDVLDIISSEKLLADDGVVICEHLAEDSLPERAGSLLMVDSRKMGTVKFDFYKWSQL